MKKYSIALCMLFLVGLLMPINVIGQPNQANSTVNLAISSSALLRIVTGATLSLSLGGATEAGAPVQEVASDSTGRLRISSMVTSQTRTITAQISPDMTSTNTELLVQLKTPNINFTNFANKGLLQTTPALLTSTGATTLITGISTCWSGIETDDGYPIRFTFRRKALATSFSSPGAITVTFTLSDN